MKKGPFVKVYNGYGHTHNMHVFGHVLDSEPVPRRKFRGGIIRNTIALLRLFFVRPLARVKVTLRDRAQELHTESEVDGFFKFEWVSEEHIKAGWHHVTATAGEHGGGEGKVFIPHITQYAFISDIDDTIMVSHSSTIGKRLRELFTKGPLRRSIFKGVDLHYKLLANAHTTPDVPNPFFYVSSSEWNLYDYLADVFAHHKLPEGVFLLSQIKRWYQLWKTGKTKHEGKLLRIVRVINTFPEQKFVLFGDNSQSDPAVYSTLVNRMPEKIFAIYIRNVNPENATTARHLLDACFKKGVHTCLFRESVDAIEHSRSIGLLG